MNILDTAAILLALAAAFSYINHRFLRLPSTIGLLVSGLLASATIVAVDSMMPHLQLGDSVRTAVSSIDFPELLMHGMLGFLLFAGSLHVNLDDLLSKRWPILSLATVGVVLSTVIVGLGSYLLFRLVNIPVPFAYCLVFGALISPTDPVAVLGIMKSVKAPKGLEIKVAGESLLNDGIGVVVFTVLIALAGGGAHGHGVGGSAFLIVGEVFLREVGGGLLLGFVAGTLTYQAMKRVNEPNLEILLSFALVMGMTFIAFRLHLSAPLACVIAGLFIGNHGRHFAMSNETREAVDLVWSFSDYALNAVLFLILGLEVMAMTFREQSLAAGVLAIPLVLLARFICVALPVSILRLRHEFSPGAIRVLTWGGLRGGISVALALSLPAFTGRTAILNATYCIVIFSILVQGMTIKPLLRRVATKG